jgi:hypothetical protein
VECDEGNIVKINKGRCVWRGKRQKAKSCSLPGSNWRPSDYETDALPTEPKELQNPFKPIPTYKPARTNHTHQLLPTTTHTNTTNNDTNQHTQLHIHTNPYQYHTHANASTTSRGIEFIQNITRCTQMQNQTLSTHHHHSHNLPTSPHMTKIRHASEPHIKIK